MSAPLYRTKKRHARFRCSYILVRTVRAGVRVTLRGEITGEYFMNRQDTLVNRIVDLMGERLPEGVAELGQDLRHNLAAVVKESLAKMDLVTREEFEIQTRVLARTRQRLEKLEQQLLEMEQNTGEPR